MQELPNRIFVRRALQGFQSQACHLWYGSLAVDDGLEHAREGDAVTLYHFGDDDQRTRIRNEALDEIRLAPAGRDTGRDALVQLEQGALDLALGQAIVVQIEQECDEVQDSGALVLELVDVELGPPRSQLQDVGNLRHLAVCDHDGMADFLPYINRVVRVHLKQIAPLPPGSCWNAALVLEPRQSVTERFSHDGRSQFPRCLEVEKGPPSCW